MNAAQHCVQWTGLSPRWNRWLAKPAPPLTLDRWVARRVGDYFVQIVILYDSDSIVSHTVGAIVGVRVTIGVGV